MILKKTLIRAMQKLKSGNTDSAPLDAEILLSFCLQKPKEFLYTYPNYQLTKTQQKKFKRLISQRTKNEPIAYLIGYKEFYGLKFFINKHVLIPRPISEQIIDKALNIINKQHSTNNNQQTTICDIGTGSGCLIIALAKKLKEQKTINCFKLYATDISAKALKVAHKNAKFHRVNKYITFLKGDLLKPLKNIKIDLIMANLPYLAKTDVKRELSIKKEPKKALIGSYDDFFKQLKKFAPQPTVIWEDKKGINISNEKVLSFLFNRAY